VLPGTNAPAPKAILSTEPNVDRCLYPLIMYPPPWLRASNADREAVVAQLSAAATEGRLTLDEFSDRTRRVYASRTWGELAGPVRDLPLRPVVDMGPTVAAPPATGSGALPLLALIFGVVSIPGGACVPVGGLAGAAGIVLGVLALRASRGVPGQRGMAMAGLICGSLGMALNVAMTVFMQMIVME
jgi:subtilisin family serine protease